MMVSLEAMSESPLEIQEVGLIEFFLNTPKPVVTIEYSFYKRFEELLKEYPVHIEKDQMGRRRRAVVAKDSNSLQKHEDAVNTVGEERFIMFGEVYGYPKTAIESFTKGNIPGQRFIVKYYGLSFVCRRIDLPQIEKEIVEMYGMPFTKDRCSLELF